MTIGAIAGGVVAVLVIAILVLTVVVILFTLCLRKKSNRNNGAMKGEAMYEHLPQVLLCIHICSV